MILLPNKSRDNQIRHVYQVINEGTHHDMDKLLEDIFSLPSVDADKFSYIVPFCLDFDQHQVRYYIKKILDQKPEWVNAITRGTKETALMRSVSKIVFQFYVLFFLLERAYRF